MKNIATAGIILILTLALIPTNVVAKKTRTAQSGDSSGLFHPIGTFDVMDGNGSGVAEIVDVTINGKQLVYTDSPNEAIGFVDISDPANPVGQGTVDVGGEPTSLVILVPLVLVGVNTSFVLDENGERVIDEDGDPVPDYVNPSSTGWCLSANTTKTAQKTRAANPNRQKWVFLAAGRCSLSAPNAAMWWASTT